MNVTEKWSQTDRTKDRQKLQIQHNMCTCLTLKHLDSISLSYNGGDQKWCCLQCTHCYLLGLTQHTAYRSNEYLIQSVCISVKHPARISRKIRMTQKTTNCSQYTMRNLTNKMTIITSIVSVTLGVKWRTNVYWTGCFNYYSHIHAA